MSIGLLLLAGCDGRAESTTAAANETTAPAPTATRPAPAPPSPTRPDDERTAALRQAYEADRGNARTRQALAIALFDAGRTAEAIELFEIAVAEQASVGNRLNLGRAYTRIALYPEAEATFRRVLATTPEQPTALHNLGNLAMRRGETAEAAAFYERATAAQPDYILAWFHLGEALRDQEQYREAYQTFSHVLDMQPQNEQETEVYVDALYEMASLDITMGVYERAAEMLAELIRVNSDHGKAHYAYGQTLLHLGRADEAQQQFAIHMDLLARQERSGTAAMGE